MMIYLYYDAKFVLYWTTLALTGNGGGRVLSRTIAPGKQSLYVILAAGKSAVTYLRISIIR